ncbi:hypothetical protein N9L68_02540 [bacterium]|nr:hypothetical protein [bacterium]
MSVLMCLVEAEVHHVSWVRCDQGSLVGTVLLKDEGDIMCRGTGSTMTCMHGGELPTSILGSSKWAWRQWTGDLYGSGVPIMSTPLLLAA